jgi:hypothetical protein
MLGVIPPRRILLFVVVSCLCASAMSSHAVITFERTYGGPDVDAGLSVQQAADGGYVIAGYATDYLGANWRGVYLVRTDPRGKILWEKVYGGVGYNSGRSVRQLADGGYAVAGFSNAFGSGGNHAYLVRTDSLGSLLWERTYYRGQGQSLVLTYDGGYVVAGYSRNPMALRAVRADSLGNALWQVMYLGYHGQSVDQFSTGGYIVAGYGTNVPHDICLARIGPLGDSLWIKTYGGSLPDKAYSVRRTSDNGFIVAGHTDSFGPGVVNVYLLKTDSLGNVLWERTYGGSASDQGWAVRQTGDGGYIVAGVTMSFGEGAGDAYLLKTDSLGNVLWERAFGGPSPDRAFSVAETQDGGYVLAGRTRSYGAGESDVYLIKTDSLGLGIPCDPIKPWEPRTQGYWRRQCKKNPHEDVCAYVDSVHILAGLFDAFDCDSICDLLNVNPPERDMCRKARRQYMALLLNVASGKLAVCNCLEDGREVGDVITKIDSLLSGDPDFRTCELAKTLADEINNGIGIVPCDTTWTQAPSKTVQPPSISVTPNPFSKSTVIEYEVEAPGSVRLEVYNSVGRLVTTVTNDVKLRGTHKIAWDGSDSRGYSVPSGIYFVYLQTDGCVTAERIVRIR